MLESTENRGVLVYPITQICPHSSPKCRDRFGAHPGSYLVSTGGAFLRSKAAGRDADNSHLPSATGTTLAFTTFFQLNWVTGLF
jgi:hypothetical protein